MKIKTLLVDDSIAFLNVATRYLGTQPVELIGRAQAGQTALSLDELHHPQLVLLDLELGEPDSMSGMTVLRMIKAQPNPPRVIVVTLHDHDEYREAARRAGADGFVPKREFATALAPLLRTLFNNVDATDPRDATTT